MKRETMSILLIVIMIGLTVYFTLYGARGWHRVATWNQMLTRTIEHVKLAGIAEFFSIITGIGLGLLITIHGLKFLASPVMGVANAGLAIPPLAFIAAALPFFGIGPKACIISLYIYCLLPVLRNVCAGMENIKEGVVESARGMGMSNMQIFWRIELPLSLPIIVAGIRVSTILCVGTAALGGLIAAGGLGQIILRGLAVNFAPLMLQGALLVTVLAIIFDLILGRVEILLTPKGLKIKGRE